MTHPISVSVDDDLERTRLTVFFRPILAIPHFIWLAIWGIAVFAAVVVSWFVTLFRGSTPLGLHNFIARYVQYATHVYGYVTLLADPYPGFLANTPYPAYAGIGAPEPQNRWITGFRMIVAIPALMLAQVLQDVWFVVALFSWVMILVNGRQPEGLRNIGAWILRFQVQTLGYVALLTDRYPELDIEPRPAPAPSPA
ncbi:MAG: DUF4389 domain-containing protein [Thermoleophilia bacterium]|nr:DUF4389 domain-containing protein [Thermoleophilia bacterium]MDH3725695.1 DUF4389 domain-containing protein [Thermoleophilia bacterium]